MVGLSRKNKQELTLFYFVLNSLLKLRSISLIFNYIHVNVKLLFLQRLTRFPSMSSCVRTKKKKKKKKKKK